MERQGGPAGAETQVNQFLKKWWWGIGLVVLVIIAVVAFFMHESIVSAGNKKQQELITFYNETTNVLSDCIVKTKEAAGVAGANTEAVDKVLSDAVRGRYETPSTAQPGGGKESLFSAIVEAYPNTEQVSNNYQQVLVVINGCRTAFKNAQAELQKHVTLFNSWREGSFFNRKLGAESYPTSSLVIEVEGKPVTGQEALTQMRKLVVVSEAKEGRDTGEIETIDPFNQESAQ